MTIFRLSAVALATWAAAVGVRTAAQKAPDPAKSTIGGVYTVEQAEKGQSLYASLCVGCHTMTTHTGLTFKKRWDGATVWDLFSTIKDTMPDDDPGSVSADDVKLIVAYLLKANGLPPGKDELTANEEALKKIKIELPEK